MRPYSKNDVKEIYEHLIRSARKNYDNRHLGNALTDIVSATHWAYNFNQFYFDPESEQLLKTISDVSVKLGKIDNPKSNRCVLIDSFLLDNRGLSQQYLRAMIFHKMEILVVYTNKREPIGNDILNEISCYEKAYLLSFQEQISPFDQANQIVKTIVEFAPTRIFLHINPWDVVALMSCNAIRGSKKYNINLTDHAFWLGASFIDFNIEFRPYGLTVSMEKRGLNKNQLIALPYYPVTPTMSEFNGFPQLPTNAVKVFTGGSLYKMLGKNDIFFRMMDSILSVASNVYILVAGFDSDKRFEEKCTSMLYGNRVVQIGVRTDIDEVFINSDIYLNTYPMMGGLMVQYAAKHGKPIIAYHDEGDAMNAVEEVVNYYQNEFQSFTDIANMVTYAKKLIIDKNFRYTQGKMLQDGMMTAERFNKEFYDAITMGETSFKWGRDSIDYDTFFNRYLQLENQNGFTATMHLVKVQKFALLKKLPGYRCRMISFLLEMIKSISFKGALVKVVKKLCGRL